MKITFIKPRIGSMENAPYIDEARMEPLTLAVLAGMLPKDVEVACYDDRFEEIPYDEPTDLVAITIESFTALRAYYICQSYRSRGVRIIAGGIHPTLIPEETAQYVDSVYIGDAESLWMEAVEDARRGKLKLLYDARYKTVAQSTQSRTTLYADKNYLPFSLCQFSRGCPHTCSFCATSAYFGQRHFCRTPEEVIREVNGRKGKIFFFVDDNFSANYPKAKALLRELIPLKIHWVGQVDIDVANDPEMVSLLKQSGCLGFVIGFESLTFGSLLLMKKTPNLTQSAAFEQQIKILHDAGFQLWAAFTLGHDCDTKTSLEETIAFALKKKFTFAAFNILTPYPGTPLYRDLNEQNRLLYDGKWWLHEGYRFNSAAFQPKHMSPDELTDLCFTMRKKFNNPFSIARRALSFSTNFSSLMRLGIFLRYNLLVRKEMLKKQGLVLGAKGVI